MSIYASFKGVDDWDHAKSCSRLVRRGNQSFEIDAERPCTCGRPPIIYQGSHIFPSTKDQRGGSVGIAAIPGHIEDERGKSLSNDIHPWWPFLRIDVYDVSKDIYAAVVLTKRQVNSLRDELTSWLENCK